MDFKSYGLWDYSCKNYKYLDADEEFYFFYDSPFKRSMIHFYNGNGYYSSYSGADIS